MVPEIKRITVFTFRFDGMFMGARAEGFQLVVVNFVAGLLELPLVAQHLLSCEVNPGVVVVASKNYQERQDDRYNHN